MSTDIRRKQITEFIEKEELNNFELQGYSIPDSVSY